MATYVGEIRHFIFSEFKITKIVFNLTCEFELTTGSPLSYFFKISKQLNTIATTNVSVITRWYSHRLKHFTSKSTLLHPIIDISSPDSRHFFTRFQTFFHPIPDISSPDSRHFFTRFQTFLHPIPDIFSPDSRHFFTRFQTFLHPIPDI